MNGIRSIFFGLIVKGLMIQTTSFKLTDEQIVHNYINRYINEIPEALSVNNSISVNVSFILNQIIDLDERQQILTTSIYIEQKWHHPRLSWTTLNMSSVKAIRMPESSVWTPDTYVYNNADDVRSGFLAGVYVLIYSDGNIQWPIRTQLKTFCSMDIKMFPFDLQTCSIDFGSWVLLGQQQILYENMVTDENKTIDLSSYTDNSDWILVSAIIKNRRNNGIKLILTLQRRSFFYIWILIVPFIMLTVLSLMTFQMPSTSKEKLSLGLSVFMAFSMFMIMISERIPPATKHVPLIGIYLATVMTMTANSIFVTVLIINIYQHKGFSRPSHKFRNIFISKLAPLFKINRSNYIDSKAQNLKFRSSFKAECNSFYKNCDLVSLFFQALNAGMNLTVRSWSVIKLQNINWHEEHLNLELKENIHQNLDYQPLLLKSIIKNKIEWELIAVVLDKIFFYIFIVTYLFIYMAIFLTPVIFKSF